MVGHGAGVLLHGHRHWLWPTSCSACVVADSGVGVAVLVGAVSIRNERLRYGKSSGKNETYSGDPDEVGVDPPQLEGAKDGGDGDLHAAVRIVPLVEADGRGWIACFVAEQTCVPPATSSIATGTVITAVEMVDIAAHGHLDIDECFTKWCGLSLHD